jgi:hypothetical protein
MVSLVPRESPTHLLVHELERCHLGQEPASELSHPHPAGAVGFLSEVTPSPAAPASSPHGLIRRQHGWSQVAQVPGGDTLDSLSAMQQRRLAAPLCPPVSSPDDFEQGASRSVLP